MRYESEQHALHVPVKGLVFGKEMDGQDESGFTRKNPPKPASEQKELRCATLGLVYRITTQLKLKHNAR